MVCLIKVKILTWYNYIKRVLCLLSIPHREIADVAFKYSAYALRYMTKHLNLYEATKSR